jgi:release factor glutamine methyltransferase
MPAPESPTAFLTYARIVAELRRAGCVFAEEEAELLIAEASDPVELEGDVRRRAAGIPLEYILGWAGFAGRRIKVEPGVFVPRRRTEVLVNEAAAILKAAGAPQLRVVLDLCCGSGAVAAALAMRVPGLELHAADIDPVAVSCARSNVEPVGGHVHEGDLFGALPLLLRGRVQVLAVNAPYVPTGAIRTMPPEARLHESRLSLDGGADGLDVHRRVAAAAPEWLGPAGHLLIETSEQQASATASIVSAAGFTVRTVRSDELDGTVVVGTLQDCAEVLPG